MEVVIRKKKESKTARNQFFYVINKRYTEAYKNKILRRKYD